MPSSCEIEHDSSFILTVSATLLNCAFYNVAPHNKIIASTSIGYAAGEATAIVLSHGKSF